MEEIELEKVPMTDSFAITKRFKTDVEFSTFIEQQAVKYGDSLIDTILAYCELNDIDEEVIAKLITKSLKEKIAVEAIENNLIIHDASGVLPL